MVEDLIGNIDIPKFFYVEQKFSQNSIDKNSIETYLEKSLKENSSFMSIRCGSKIGITVGSRGIAHLNVIVKKITDCIKEVGGIPFIIPSMGSHGGATAEGQKKIVENFGISEGSTGAKIISSMEVDKIGDTKNGLPVYVDRNALKLDGIIVLNRVKPHTDINGPIESGLQKMLAIGLGKQRGAEICHEKGLENTLSRIEEISSFMLDNLNIICGIAIIENAYDELFDIEVISKDKIKKEEPKLLILSKQLMPRLLINDIDILIVDYMGKNVSGDGMDPNVIGRGIISTKNKDIKINRIVILNLTNETMGSAMGIGLADYTTKKVFDKIDFEEMYPNAITAMAPEGVEIPMVLENDRLAIKAAIKMQIKNIDQLRIVRIKDTLHLNKIYISESMKEDIDRNSRIKILEGPLEFLFDAHGNLVNKW